MIALLVVASLAAPDYDVAAEFDEPAERPRVADDGPAGWPWGLVGGPVAAGLCAAGGAMAALTAVAGTMAAILLCCGDGASQSPTPVLLRWAALITTWWVVVASGPTLLAVGVADAVGMSAGEMPRFRRPARAIKDLSVAALLGAPSMLGALVGITLIIAPLFLPLVMPPDSWAGSQPVILTSWVVGFAVVAASAAWLISVGVLLRPAVVVLGDAAMR